MLAYVAPPVDVEVDGAIKSSVWGKEGPWDIPRKLHGEGPGARHVSLLRLEPVGDGLPDVAGRLKTTDEQATLFQVNPLRRSSRIGPRCGTGPGTASSTARPGTGRRCPCGLGMVQTAVPAAKLVAKTISFTSPRASTLPRAGSLGPGLHRRMAVGVVIGLHSRKLGHCHTQHTCADI